MSLLDVNALVALAWDSHVHHATMKHWFSSRHAKGWSTCAITENGFVGVSSNPKVLPNATGVDSALSVLSAFRAVEGHRFISDDVSPTDDDVPRILSHRQVTDAHLLTLARRNDMKLVTFDAGLADLAKGRGVELLRTL